MGTTTGVTRLSVDSELASKFGSTIFDATDGFRNLENCAGFDGYPHVPSSACPGAEPERCVQVWGEYNADAQSGGSRILTLEDLVRHLHAFNVQANVLQGEQSRLVQDT